MSIVTNLCKNPSFETGTSYWVGAGGSIASVPSDVLAGVVGASVSQVTADGTGPFLITRGSSLAADRFPIVAGQWAAVRGWVTADPGLTSRLSLVFLDAAGSALLTALTGYIAANGLEGAFLTHTVQAPANAASWRFEVQSYSGGGAIPAGTRVYTDQWMAVTAATQAAATSAAKSYGDGDSDGWAWNGTAHASTSTGPSKPYSPDAELTGQSGFHAWLDMVPEFVAESSSRTVVQLPQQVRAVPYVVGRNAGPRTGTLRVHFVRELADGTPGERSAALEEQLRTASGARTLTWVAEVGGLETFQFIPTGRIVRRLERASIGRRRLAVWTVEWDYTEAT